MRPSIIITLTLALLGATAPAFAENACVERYHHTRSAGYGGVAPPPIQLGRSGGIVAAVPQPPLVVPVSPMPPTRATPPQLTQPRAQFAPPPSTARPYIATAPVSPPLQRERRETLKKKAGPPGATVAIPDARPPVEIRKDDDKFPEHKTNKPQVTAENPVSTFGADVDTASYAVIARMLRDGLAVPADAVRVEELINYFDYHYATADSVEAGFKPEIQVVPSPWHEGRKLVRIGLKAYEVPKAQRPAANLVFLMDTSGSMGPIDRLPLAKVSVCLLLDELRDDDRVSIVTYAGGTRVALTPTAVSEKDKVLAVLDGLESGGSTAGASGINLAYAQAREAFRRGGINRVVLMTDGDFNVGISDPRRLKDLVEKERKSGVTLTVLGYGMGNYKDTTMQTLAEAGNGQADYIGSLADARRSVMRGIGGNLFTVATDTKFQVEFNPARVAEWRLIGYESRALERSDFDNDRVDAGDVNAGQSVTVLYEIVPVGQKGDVPGLRYQEKKDAPADTSGEYGFLKIRFKAPGKAESKLLTLPIGGGLEVDTLDGAAESTRFAVAVAWIGQILRRDTAMDAAGLPKALDLAKGAIGPDKDGDRLDFVAMMKKAKLTN